MPNLSYDFGGRTAIVTGAARGIGLAVARQFAEAGADVVMVDLEDDVVRAAATRLGAIPVAADVSTTDEVERIVAAAVEATGRLDIVINNAGILRDKVLWKLDDNDWEAVLGVHLGGTFRLTRACVPHFRRQSSGRVINVTSYAGLHGNVGQAAYAAAKAGIIGLTKTAAKELARFGVTVNAISPNTETRMTKMIPPEKRAELEALIPLRRFADPAEISATVAFHASDEAAYLTGAVVPVDGGMSM
jgi:3-oxoacyl-[acyl-carrier protein] reductase